MSSTNPYSPVYNAIRDLLYENAAFQAEVPVALRLTSVGGSGNPLRGASQAADFPSTLIEPMDGVEMADWSNTSAVVKKRFQIKMATGNRQADLALKLEWIILTAMVGWEIALGALTWRNHPYVAECHLVTHEETQQERRELTRSETGWATVWVGEVWMEFPHADIVPGPG